MNKDHRNADESHERSGSKENQKYWRYDNRHRQRVEQNWRPYNMNQWMGNGTSYLTLPYLIMDRNIYEENRWTVEQMPHQNIPIGSQNMKVTILYVPPQCHTVPCHWWSLVLPSLWWYSREVVIIQYSFSSSGSISLPELQGYLFAW